MPGRATSAISCARACSRAISIPQPPTILRRQPHRQRQRRVRGAAAQGASAAAEESGAYPLQAPPSCKGFGPFHALQEVALSEPQSAAIAVAGPVRDGRCVMTNLGWTIDAAEVQREFGFRWARRARWGEVFLGAWV